MRLYCIIIDNYPYLSFKYLKQSFLSNLKYLKQSNKQFILKSYDKINKKFIFGI